MEKIPKSNYTQIPNVFFDEIMKKISPSDNLVLMTIMRKTFGWQKQVDKISYSQIIEMTGLVKSTVSISIKSLEEKGLIYVTREGQINTYSVVVHEHNDEKELVRKSNMCENRTVNSPKIEQLNDKTSSKIEHTKESNINKLSKEIYEEIEKAYESCFYEVKPSGKLFIDYPRIRKRTKELLERITKDEIISVIQNAKTDDWIKDNGFQFSTILSDFQVAKLLNGKPEGRRGYSKPLPVQTRTTFLDMED